MRKYEKLSRKYKYRMKQKYSEDPFAFLILWSLFFSAVFLVFAFRGLIAAIFMPKVDVSDQPIVSEDTLNPNSANSTDKSPANNSDLSNTTE
ncbi:MAG: hypothetical protein V1807_02685 [Patescibacteria group bacterium]